MSTRENKNPEKKYFRIKHSRSSQSGAVVGVRTGWVVEEKAWVGESDGGWWVGGLSKSTRSKKFAA